MRSAIGPAAPSVTAVAVPDPEVGGELVSLVRARGLETRGIPFEIVGMEPALPTREVGRFALLVSGR